MTTVTTTSDQASLISALLQERGVTFRNQLLFHAMKPVIDRPLHLSDAIALHHKTRHLEAHDCFREIIEASGFEVDALGLENIPNDSPVMLVANHPTGVVDLLILYALLSPIRNDFRFVAHRDALRFNPKLSRIIIPAEWRDQYSTIHTARETALSVKQHFKEHKNGLMGVFPSGRVSARSRGNLQEYPWKTTAMKIAENYSLPIVPVHVDAKNSTSFYLVSHFWESMRNALTFREIFTKKGQKIKVHFGTQIRPPKGSAEIEEYTHRLQRVCSKKLYK
ncbi:1-acyl-sn-glycerol-3-phosphate acyltransferase [Roseobacter cerasinus]|uniref:1-acyl-sn-glycerol-3-phosphate acyltransferase n=1 Tax=Roseobacter cerasinus TaxID=2602289 RepID=UPI00135AC111|nr:1-acyl-sn-glycerol-3-phosphate acyltransferase [Roseobacter cerasinus]